MKLSNGMSKQKYIAISQVIFDEKYFTLSDNDQNAQNVQSDLVSTLYSKGI